MSGSDVNKEGSLNTGVGDCEDYVLAKYAALHQAGVPDENLRMVLVRDDAVRADMLSSLFAMTGVGWSSITAGISCSRIKSLNSSSRFSSSKGMA